MKRIGLLIDLLILAASLPTEARAQVVVALVCAVVGGLVVVAVAVLVIGWHENRRPQFPLTGPRP